MILKCDEVMSIEQVGKDTATFGDDLDELLQPLLDDGIVQTESHTPPAIRLTEKGEHLLGQLWGVVETAEEQILHGFSEPERRQLFDYLRRIQSNCIRIVG